MPRPRGFLWERSLCYIDDVIVFGETFEKTLQNLELVFGRFRSANLKLKPNKCTLFQTEVLFLGHIVSNKGISCDPGRVASVQNWPVPTTVTEVKSFLGLAGYYRKFIPNFSEIASSLTELTIKCKKFVWTDNCQTAFDRLVELLTSAPVLAFPKRTGEFIIDTDASANGIGAVLSQVQDGEERVIAYSSKTLNDSQRKYCTTYRELLAVVVFVKQFRHYVWGNHFTIRTDHASLVWLKNFKDPEGILARWLSILDTYDFTLEHRKSSLHTNADSLSRITHKKCIRSDCPDCTNETLVTGEASESYKTKINSLRLAPVRVFQPDRGDTQDSVQDGQNRNTAESPDHGRSRLNSTNEQNLDVPIPNWLNVWTDEQISDWQQKDLDIKTILQNSIF